MSSVKWGINRGDYLISSPMPITWVPKNSNCPNLAWICLIKECGWTCSDIDSSLGSPYLDLPRWLNNLPRYLGINGHPLWRKPPEIRQLWDTASQYYKPFDTAQRGRPWFMYSTWTNEYSMCSIKSTTEVMLIFGQHQEGWIWHKRTKPEDITLLSAWGKVWYKCFIIRYPEDLPDR
jgi:hypothetical protein